jgi:hypothetical protein
MNNYMNNLPLWLKNAKCEVDPYLRTALATTFLDHLDDLLARTGVFPLIIEAKKNRLEEVFTLIGFDSNNRVDLLDFSLQSRFIVAYVSVNTLKELHAFDAVQRIEMAFFLQVQRSIKAAGKKALPSSISHLTSNKTKLIGVIDNGCPFAHQAVRAKGGGTRVFSIWDQNDIYDSTTMPHGMTYGRVLSRDMLNSLMVGSTYNGVLDESLCYQESELGMLQHGRSHGAHTLGLAAGNFSFRAIGKSQVDVGKIPLNDDASESDIVFVQLPKPVIQAPTRGSQALHLLNALRYLVACAGKKNKDIYAVIDYGSYLGPHDGTSLFERAVDELVLQVNSAGKKLHVIFAVGNGRNERFHANILTQINKTKSVELWIPPANEASVFAEIWLYKGSVFKSLKLTSPDGQSSATYSVLDSVNSLGDQIAPIATISGSKMRDGQICILVRIAPTRTQNAYQLPAPDGRWLIELKAESSKPVHCYVSRGGRNFGAPPRTLQARWKIPADMPLDKDIRIDTYHTTIGAGCGNEVMMVGSYKNWKNKEPTKYSGRGPRRGGKYAQIGPKMLFPSEEAQSLRGIRGIGNYSGTSYRLVGTSTAPPQAVRVL